MTSTPGVPGIRRDALEQPAQIRANSALKDGAWAVVITVEASGEVTPASPQREDDSSSAEDEEPES